MNMPAFTAEASIYTTVNRYSGSAEGITKMGPAVVIPQVQQCVGGGICGDGWHCCGDGTRDWCCPQTCGCGGSFENDPCWC